MRKIIVITGQTATGKTSFALKLAKKKGGELISADARQIYKHLDIITGKDLGKNPVFEENLTPGVRSYIIKGIKIWLLDAVDPKDPFSSYDYKNLAIDVINNTISKNKIPIVVGGSYLYIKHLLYGFDTEGVGANWKLRDELNNKSVEELVDMLKTIDIRIFNQMNSSDQKNPRRLIRRIEVAQSKHTTPGVGELHKKTPGVNKQFELLDFIGLRFKTKKKLIITIKKRVEERLRMGAIEEVKNLLNIGYKKTDPGLQTIGYKQIIEYLEGKTSKDEAIKKWISSEIQYAKRQYTFMKQDKNISWRDV